MVGLLLMAVFAANAVPHFGDVRLRGSVGERLDGCIEQNVMRTDPLYLSACFHHRTETSLWQTEFWGKWMHSAVPFWQYTRNGLLKARIDAGVRDILAAQLPDGYLGNYREQDRCRHDWDVWGMKYTMLGLIHYFDATGDQKALSSACRVCDYLGGPNTWISPNTRFPNSRTLPTAAGFFPRPKRMFRSPIVASGRQTASMA